MSITFGRNGFNLPLDAMSVKKVTKKMNRARYVSNEITTLPGRAWWLKAIGALYNLRLQFLDLLLQCRCLSHRRDPKNKNPATQI